MDQQRDRSKKAEREEHFEQTNKTAAAIIDADLRAKRKKSKRLRQARLEAEVQHKKQDPHPS
jgi:hypothetical protein